MLKSKASIALAQILTGAFALERVAKPLTDGIQIGDFASILASLQANQTLEQILDGAAAIREVGTLGDVTISELIEILKPHVPELK